MKLSNVIRFKSITKIMLYFFGGLFIYLYSINTTTAARRYWVGSGASNWNSVTNWSDVSGGVSGFSVPGVSDIAFFDGGNSFDCNINDNVNINGFSISSLYTGAINVSPGITINVTSGGFSQAGGTFVGNNGNILIGGAFNLSGGAFTSTSAILQISGGYLYSGGTFNHNNGTVAFSNTQSITGSTNMYTILFNGNGGTYSLSSGTVLTSINNVIIATKGSCIINTGVIEIQGDLTLTTTTNASYNGGTGTFLFDGISNQNINSSISTLIIGANDRVCPLPNVEINKSTGSINLYGVINMSGATWKTIAGASLINPGTSTLNIVSNISFSDQNLSLYNIHIMANSAIITLTPASYKLTSTNNVTINGGGYYRVDTGILEIQGDLTLTNTSTSAFNGGSGTFLFNGTGVQNINSAASSLNFICSTPSIEINKPSGALNITGIINFNGSSWNTVAGASLVNTGTAVVNLLKSTTLSGQNLSFYDITVTGNFSTTIISAGLVWTSTHLLTLAGGGSWYQINTGTLNAKGDVLVTNTNTSFNVGGNAILLFDGTANQLLTGSGIPFAGRLPQVHINKTGGILTFANPIISMDNNWNYIAGNVDAITNSSTIDFYRTSTIDGQGISTMSFYNVIISGQNILGGNMDVDGDFTIRSGVSTRLDVSASNYQLNVAGNWINNNSATAISFNQQNGKVVFDGVASQTLTLDIASNSEIFYNMEINNTSTGLTLIAPVTILNNVNFITGKIISSASTVLLLNNLATATGASNISFVSGPVVKTGNQAFVFPVGKNTSYAPIAISAPSVNTNQFTAEYYLVDPNILYDVTSKDISLDHISRCEYWTLNRTSGSSNVFVTLSWDNRSCGVTVLSDLRVAYWNGSQWNDKGNGGTAGSTVTGTIISAAAVTAYGIFSLTSFTDENPLPIEFIDFKGNCNGNHVDLFWTTIDEFNNDYFTIERKSDNLNWKAIGTIESAGGTNTMMNYSYTDNIPFTSFVYYRLKQTDYNGKSEYSEILKVENCKFDNVESEMLFYPNPSNGIIEITNDTFFEKDYLIEIYDALYQEVSSYTIKNESLDLLTVDLSKQRSGIYFIHLTYGNKTVVERIALIK